MVYQRANAVLTLAAAVQLLDLERVVGIKDGRGGVDGMLRLVTAIRTSGHPRAESFGFLNGLPTAELSVAAYEAIGVDSYSSAVLCFAPDIATAFYRAYRSGDKRTMNALLAEFYLPLVTHTPWQCGVDVVEKPLSFVDGAVPVPSSPGLGVTLDRDALARMHEDYLSCGIRERDDTGYYQRFHPEYERLRPQW